MPAKNVCHDAVRDSLVADGWTVTDDPLFPRVGERDLYIDLGAERPGGEAVAIELIAVEVQSFGGRSPVAALQQAVGQFGMYRAILDDQQPQRALYLAVPFDVYDGILSEPLGERMAGWFGLKFLLFDPTRREKPRWIK